MPKCKNCGAEMMPHFPSIKAKHIGSYVLWLCPNVKITADNTASRKALIYCIIPKPEPEQPQIENVQ